MKYFLIIFSLACFNEASGQKYFVMEYNNDTTYASHSVKHETPFLKKNHFLLDNEVKVPSEKVVLYQNREGYFRRTSFPDGFFVRRITDGSKIDEYATEVSTYTPSHGPGFGGMGYHNQKTVYYYSFNEGGLKEMKYSYLKKEIGDNPASLDYLNKIKSQRLTAGILYTIGAGMLVYGISKSKFTNNNTSVGGVSSYNSNDEKGYISPFVFGSFIPLAIPAFMGKKRVEHMRDAIAAYNR